MRAPSSVAVVRAGSALMQFAFSLLGILALWIVVKWAFSIEDYVLPGPDDTYRSTVNSFDVIMDNFKITAWNVVCAFVLAAVVGVAIGLAMSSSAVVEKLLYPQFVVLQAIPKIALAPILLSWLGFGFRMNVMLGFLIAVFPVVVNTLLGMKECDPMLLRMGRAMGGNRWRIYRRIQLPSALPSIFAGLRIAVTFALIGTVVGEFVASSEGLGYGIVAASGALNTSLAFAQIIFVSILGLLTYYCVVGLEHLVLGRRQQ